jgi:hypothetical protein
MESSKICIDLDFMQFYLSAVKMRFAGKAIIRAALESH